MVATVVKAISFDVKSFEKPIPPWEKPEWFRMSQEERQKATEKWVWENSDYFAQFVLNIMKEKGKDDMIVVSGQDVKMALYVKEKGKYKEISRVWKSDLVNDTEFFDILWKYEPFRTREESKVLTQFYKIEKDEDYYKMLEEFRKEEVRE